MLSRMGKQEKIGYAIFIVTTIIFCFILETKAISSAVQGIILVSYVVIMATSRAYLFHSEEIKERKEYINSLTKEEKEEYDSLIAEQRKQRIQEIGTNFCKNLKITAIFLALNLMFLLIGLTSPSYFILSVILTITVNTLL